MSTPRRFLRYAAAVVLVLAVVAALGAQSPAPAGQTPATPAVLVVNVTVGRSTIIATPFDISRIAITNAAVADATAVTPREILIDGKSMGTVSMIVWGGTARLQYDLVVDPGVSALQRQLQALFPDDDIKSNETPDIVVLTGHASSTDTMLRAGEIATAMAPKAKVVNMLQVPGGPGSQQVMLQVRVAEVNRRVLTEAGSSVFTGAAGYKDVIARATTEQFPSATFDSLKQTVEGGQVQSASGNLTFSDFLNLFVFSEKYQIGALIKALETKGDLQSLAEPNLIAYNGQEASFLAGGELPIPVVQGATGTVSIQFKEFGIKLNFVPTIAGDMIRLKVAPEVSSLDFANGVTLGGFRIPALLTRKASTDVELRDGQSFAIAGLMNNSVQDTRESVPFLSRIPIIGVLFKGKSNDRQRTELMVLVTPHLVKPLNPDEVPTLPTVQSEFLPPCSTPNCEGSTPAQAPAAPAGGR